MINLFEICDEDTGTSISRKIEEENTLFRLLETERGRSFLLRAARAAKPRTLSRVWQHFQPIVPALIVREETCHLIEKLVEESPEIFQLGGDLETMKLMMRTSHCTGLVRVIAATAQDEWLIKMTNWMISDLENVLLNITSGGPTVILEELFSKFPIAPMSPQTLNKYSMQAGELLADPGKVWRMSRGLSLPSWWRRMEVEVHHWW